MTDERNIQLIYQLAGQPSETKTVAEWAKLLKDQGLELCSFCQFRPNCPKHNYILKPRAPRLQPRCWYLDDPDALISATSVATLVSTGAHLPPDAATRHPGAALTLSSFKEMVNDLLAADVLLCSACRRAEGCLSCIAGGPTVDDLDLSAVLELWYAFKYPHSAEQAGASTAQDVIAPAT